MPLIKHAKLHFSWGIRNKKSHFSWGIKTKTHTFLGECQWKHSSISKDGFSYVTHYERLLTIIPYIPLPLSEKPLLSRHARQERIYDQRAVREKTANVCGGKERIAIFAASLRRKDILRRTFGDAVPTGKFW